jgi:hypothetical protein
MNQNLLSQIKEEWPDWEEWIGELWLQWEQVSARRLGVPTGARRWAVTVAEIERIRREVRNEGRLSGLSYRETMDDIPDS